MSVHSQIDSSDSSVAPQGKALLVVPAPEECRHLNGAVFWQDEAGWHKLLRAEYEAAWAAQQAADEEDLRFHLPCELEEEGNAESPPPPSPEPHPRKSHPAGRGWIASGRDIGLPGEGPDAVQAAFGDGGFAEAGSPPSSSPRTRGPSAPCAGGEDWVPAFAGMTKGESVGASASASSSLHDGDGHLPHTTFTPERQMRFCDRLAACGNVRMACAMSGISAMTAYRARRRDPLFAQVWDRALALARDHAEAVLAVRALEGIAEPVFHRGEVVGHKRRYDSKLLLAHLGRLDRRCEALDARALHGEAGDVEAFDLLLARLGRLEEAEGALAPRGDHVEQAGAEAERAALEEACPGDPWAEDFEPDEDAECDEDECGEDECGEEDAAGWDGHGPDPILLAGEEARGRAGAEWDEAHAALCARIDGICGEDEPEDEVPEEDQVPGDLPYEVKGRAGSGEGCGLFGSVTGVTGWPLTQLRQIPLQLAPLRVPRLYCAARGV